ncbi:MAG: GGDEF domain-containing protein, partial [bacterium]|nr:GGDEF domain-containing protein [bacterium]
MSYPESMGNGEGAELPTGQNLHKLSPLEEETARKEVQLEEDYMKAKTTRLDTVIADHNQKDSYLKEERRVYREHRQRERELEEAAGRDTMIKELYNKKRFRELVTVEIQRALRTGRPLAILAGDCDGF